MALTNNLFEQRVVATQLPKAEVHVHLEGCFDPEQLSVWAKESGIALPRPKEDLLNFKGLTDFLAFLDWSSSLVSTHERLAQLSYSYAQRLTSNGGIYADLIFNPTHWKAWHRKLDSMIDAIDSGLRAAEQDGLASVGLCVSLLRQQSASESIELVEYLVALKHPRVVALSVDGNEAVAGRTGHRFAEAFSRAGNAGLKRTVHAGESSGPQGVSDAILLLGADRIDHGVRAIEDPKVVDLLTERNIPIGVCPTSNIRLGVYESFEQHPLNQLLESGVKVTINTDDPVLLNTTLVDEYLICQNTFGWSNEVFYQVAKNSIDASFAAPEEKVKFLNTLSNWESQYCTR